MPCSLRRRCRGADADLEAARDLGEVGRALGEAALELVADLQGQRVRLRDLTEPLPGQGLEVVSQLGVGGAQRDPQHALGEHQGVVLRAEVHRAAEHAVVLVHVRRPIVGEVDLERPGVLVGPRADERGVSGQRRLHRFGDRRPVRLGLEHDHHAAVPAVRPGRGGVLQQPVVADAELEGVSHRVRRHRQEAEQPHRGGRHRSLGKPQSSAAGDHPHHLAPHCVVELDRDAVLGVGERLGSHAGRSQDGVAVAVVLHDRLQHGCRPTDRLRPPHAHASWHKIGRAGGLGRPPARPRATMDRFAEEATTSIAVAFGNRYAGAGPRDRRKYRSG